VPEGARTLHDPGNTYQFIVIANTGFSDAAHDKIEAK
jgi:hypothetical protein